MGRRNRHNVQARGGFECAGGDDAHQRRPIAGSEALRSVRNGWQLLVVEGSGRFADELSAAVRNGQVTKSVEVSEIARSGRVTIFPVNDPAEKLRNELRRMLRY